MSNSKISALTGATTPLAGTEVLPIVQSSTTKQVSVANLTAGRAISATSVTASTGNFIVGTSGQGIDFSTTPGTGTSELLADYEEGTWTPTQGGGLTVVGSFSSSGTYTKVGRQVTVIGSLSGSTSITNGGGAVMCAGLPYSVTDTGTGSAINGTVNAGATCVCSVTSIFATAISATTVIYFSATYFV